MTGSEAKKILQDRYKNQNDYNKRNYDRVSVMLPKGRKDILKAFGVGSLNGYINGLIDKDLERLRAENTDIVPFE